MRETEAGAGEEFFDELPFMLRHEAVWHLVSKALNSIPLFSGLDASIQARPLPWWPARAAMLHCECCSVLPALLAPDAAQPQPQRAWSGRWLCRSHAWLWAGAHTCESPARR